MLHFSIYGHEHGTVFISKDNPVDPALYTWIEITDEEFLQIYNWMKKNRPHAIPKVEEKDRFTILDHEG